MKWLDNVLADATKEEQSVILCSHVPLYPHHHTAYAFLWNYGEVRVTESTYMYLLPTFCCYGQVMEIIKKYECVKLILAGHDHSGGYTHHHAHHYIFKGVVRWA